MQTPEANERMLDTAYRIVEDAWDELRRRLPIQRKLGIVPARLPDISFAEAKRRSDVGRSLLARLNEINEPNIPHDLALTLRLIRFRARNWSREADWYWTVTDPVGSGFYGLFLPTAYCGGMLLNYVHNLLASFPFTELGDAHRYLGLVTDYACLIDQFAERTEGQAQRGIRMPKAQVAQARALLANVKSQLHRLIGVAPQRIRSILSADDLTREIDDLIANLIEPSFDRVLAGFSDDYFAQAPDSVGIGQYPGGADLYRELAKLHTTLELTPEEIHSIGLDRLARIDHAMQTIRGELQFDGNDTAFMQRLSQDPRWRATTDAELQAVFQRYIDRFSSRFSEFFASTPMATQGAAPLPESLQGAMTFGYYDAPQRGRPEGRYMYNAANLRSQALIRVAAITYHELMPGHHLHLATQQENDELHPFRKYSFVNAYNEAWAEYAAAFAGEIGLYEQPEERYGRLLSDAFLTCRLVVDTGMNSLGWSLERAQELLRRYSGLSEAEIVSESIRYSCDIPGQSLAYKLGDARLFALRDRVRRELGNNFSLKGFHEAVLGPGALPLTDLEWHLDYEIACGRVQS